MYYKHRYNLIRFDLSTTGTAYKLFIKSLYDYVIVKEVTVSDVTTRSYFIGAKDLEANWTNKASLTYSTDIKGRKLLNEGQNWLAAAGQGDTFTGLLDEYSGATAAYSLRLLSSNYSGDAIVVRRSSDNATQSIGFNNNELDTASLTTFCSGANGFVTTWFDQSGNGNNATQTIASFQPKIFDSVSGIIEIEGKPAIYTDGVSGGLDISTPIATGQKYTFSVNTINDIIWAMYAESVGSSNIMAIGQSGSALPVSNGYTLNTLYHNTNAFTGTRNDLYTLYDTTGQSLTTIDFDGAGIGVLFNRVVYSLNGFVQEVIIYNSDESSNRNGIEDNINNYYSIY